MQTQSTMTRKDRMLAAVRRQPVDRVPYATYNLHPYGGGPSSYESDQRRSYRSPQVDDATYAPLLQRVRDHAGAFIKTHAGGVGYGLTRHVPDQAAVTYEGAGDHRVRIEILRTPKGDLTRKTHVPEGKPGMVFKPFVENESDMAKFMSIPYEPPVYDMALTKTVYADAADRAMIAVTYSEPMHTIAVAYGFEPFCVECITDLPKILRQIAWAQERCMENMRLLCEACKGMDVLLHTGGPEICTPPMMSPELFAKMVTPSLTQLIAVIHDAGLLAAVHCHGRVREVFPEIVKSGADLLEPIEPPNQGNIAIAELMAQAAGRICVMGHIQDQEFYSAPAGHMTRCVEQIARVVDGRTGYIMSPTCTPFEIPCTDVYQRNYVEWLDAAERLL